MKKITYLICLGLAIFLGISFSPEISGYQIEDLNLTAHPAGDFSLGPGKIELWMNAGEELFKELLINRRIGKTTKFKIEIEDFKGSQDPEKAVMLLGEKKGPYSLKDYLHPEVTEFTLEYGERMTLPIEISIPRDAKPGGLYGVVLIAIEPADESEEIEGPGEIRVISRLGSLFFVRIKGETGETIESGFLKDFRIEKSFYEKGPIAFESLFENNGNIYLVPYGIIEIKNFLGKKVNEIELNPWFVMPDSLRLRDIQWKGLMFGRYTANIKVNRGYQDIIDEKSVIFWIIPWKIILLVLVILAIIIYISTWLFSRFEVKRKTSP